MTTNNSTAIHSSVPKVHRSTVPATSNEKSGHGWFMMACCVAMFAAFGFVIFTAPAGQAWSATVFAALPLLGCVGVHLLMYKFIGKSCHGGGSKKSNSTENER